MQKLAALRVCVVATLVFGACKDSPPEPPDLGPPAQLVVTAGDNQSALANTEVPQPIRVQVQDADGDALGAGLDVTFTVVNGGGAIVGPITVTTDATGTVTAPGWRLGKSAVPQIMRAAHGSITWDVVATVTTQYNIVVRFFGDPISTENQAFFENAAARLEAIITGDVVDATTNNTDLSSQQACGQPGLPTVTETVDDIVIYAAITAIDGSGSVLGQASPCLGRSTPTMVAYGYMKFDVADFGSIANKQEVILHEMLHVLGSGTIWEIDRALITGKGGADPRFVGPLARDACIALGGPVTCATSVPLENTGNTGTRDFHWRDATFGTELMTGFYNTGANQLSSMTIASMADLGFVVNMAADDPYTFAGPMQLGRLAAGWEQVGTLRGRLHADGRVEPIVKFK
jgi:hypothetical protein